ncbi:MAG: sugar ABC transporter permease [Firmicutes bacterium]|nr:sugar ABC transporter permease [Bacillota bacterium]
MVKAKGGKSGKKGMTMSTKNAISGYLFILPFIIGFVAFMAYPLYQTVRFAFSFVTMDAVNNTFFIEWTGLENLRRALTIDPDFVRFLTEEIVQMAFVVPAIVIFSLFVAIMLNRKFPGRAFVRAIFFLPVILASGVLIGIETNNSLLDMVATQIQDQNAMRANVTGFIEDLLISATGAGVMGDFVFYILDITNEIYTIAMASGIQILIFLAGLQTISPSIFEAASIEGATAWENFWKITFPMVSPMILVVVVYSIVDFMVRTDSEVMNMVEIQIMRLMNFGFGSALALVFFLAIAAILGVVGFIISRLVYYYD